MTRFPPGQRWWRSHQRGKLLHGAGIVWCQRFSCLCYFPPISYKNYFFSKIPIINRNFFAFPESSLYVGNFRHKRGAVKKCLIIFSQPHSPAGPVILSASEESRCKSHMRQSAINPNRREGSPREADSYFPIPQSPISNPQSPFSTPSPCRLCYDENRTVILRKETSCLT